MAEAAVFHLIKTQNKPFGVQGLVDNLQTAGIKKAAVQKAVDALSDSGKITCKEFGKTKLYLPKQDGLEVLSKEDMEARKAEQKQLLEALQAAHKAAREAEAELRSWNNSMSVEEMRAKVAALTQQRDVQATKLSGLRSGAKLVSADERRAAEAGFRAAMEVWRKRRGVFRGIWDTISEGMEGKQSDLFEEIGVDTDEAAGVTYAELESRFLRAAARGVKRPRSIKQ
ncbi:hypothetical protein OEZ86_003531 [Tetradesmus obliquus]|nr:hypothetical protein OEZ86_003531 [Tetradesmus obliquus]